MTLESLWFFMGGASCQGDDAGDILRLLEAPEGRLADIVLDHGLGGHAAKLRLPGDLPRLHAGLHETGADRVHPDACGGELARERLRPAQDREFRGGVMGEKRCPDLRRE
jgi:hypothetical protein